MRVLVFGGRNFAHEQFLCTALENLLFNGLTVPADLFIIEGACSTGADDMAYRWRLRNGIEGQRFPVTHSVDGPWPAAGPKRNSRMLRLGRPDMGIGFPGGRGTADMAGKLRAAGIKTIEIEYREHKVI